MHQEHSKEPCLLSRRNKAIHSVSQKFQVEIYLGPKNCEYAVKYINRM